MAVTASGGEASCSVCKSYLNADTKYSDLTASEPRNEKAGDEGTFTGAYAFTTKSAVCPTNVRGEAEGEPLEPTHSLSSM